MIALQCSNCSRAEREINKLSQTTFIKRKGNYCEIQTAPNERKKRSKVKSKVTCFFISSTLLPFFQKGAAYEASFSHRGMKPRLLSNPCPTSQGWYWWKLWRTPTSWVLYYFRRLFSRCPRFSLNIIVLFPVTTLLQPIREDKLSLSSPPLNSIVHRSSSLQNFKRSPPRVKIFTLELSGCQCTPNLRPRIPTVGEIYSSLTLRKSRVGPLDPWLGLLSTTLEQ